MLMVVYHPAASQPAKEAGEFLGKQTGSVSGGFRLLWMCELLKVMVVGHYEVLPSGLGAKIK